MGISLEKIEEIAQSYTITLNFIFSASSFSSFLFLLYVHVLLSRSLFLPSDPSILSLSSFDLFFVLRVKPPYPLFNFLPGAAAPTLNSPPSTPRHSRALLVLLVIVLILFVLFVFLFTHLLPFLHLFCPLRSSLLCLLRIVMTSVSCHTQSVPLTRNTNSSFHLFSTHHVARRTGMGEIWGICSARCFCLCSCGGS